MEVTYTLDYRGPWLSWNTMLTLNRWQRSKLVGEAKLGYRGMLLRAGVKPLQDFQMSVRYWSRIDADNICLKYIIDTLRTMNLVVNDDKRYFRGVTSITDASLGHNQYVITIVGTLAAESPTLVQPLVKPKRGA